MLLKQEGSKLSMVIHPLLREDKYDTKSRDATDFGPWAAVDLPDQLYETHGVTSQPGTKSMTTSRST